MNTEENKQQLFKWGRIVLMVLTVVLSIGALIGLKSLRGIDPAYNSISITGEGEAIAVPDVATFSFTVSADAKVVSDAQADVTRKMDKILADLKDMGVEDKDIKTTNYSVYPKYSYPQIYCITTPCPPTRQVQDGYTVSHDVTVKIRKTGDAGKALSLAGADGATGLSGISFTVDDPDKVMNEAREAAIKDAKEKAETLSKQLGVRLVRVVNFYDNSGGIPYYAEAGMGRDMAVKNATAPSLPIPTLPIGENKVTINVTVVYEIR